MKTPLRVPLLFAACALAGGCASTQLEAQWIDPQFAPGSLRGARVLVACDAAETVVKRICQDQLAAEVVARGATPIATPENTAASADTARTAGARAVLMQRIVPYGTNVSPGFSIGLGGFGIGSGGFGGGVGVSAPIGGGQVTTGYAADTRLTDASSGRLLWTAKASAPPSQDLQTQLMELTRAVFGAADKAGVF